MIQEVKIYAGSILNEIEQGTVAKLFLKKGDLIKKNALFFRVRNR